MEKFQLSQLLTIHGIGAASGIVFLEDLLYLISDNSSYLYKYHLKKNQLEKIPLIENPNQNTPKKEKLDLEAITFNNNNLILIGSGSTKNRTQSFIYNLKNQLVSKQDLSKIYLEFIQKINIKPDELNIEGYFLYNQNHYFFQRGNGENSKNGVFVLKNNNTIDFTSIQLPKIKHVEATFTDAILIDQTIYFLASAEDTISTYEDGEVMGTLFGSMDLETFQINFTYQISNKHKFEGLTLYQKTNSEIEFLLCEDNDSDELISTIYKLIIDNG